MIGSNYSMQSIFSCKEGQKELLINSVILKHVYKDEIC
jgi:hypothetical protein